MSILEKRFNAPNALKICADYHFHLKYSEVINLNDRVRDIPAIGMGLRRSETSTELTTNFQFTGVIFEIRVRKQILGRPKRRTIILKFLVRNLMWEVERPYKI